MHTLLSHYSLCAVITGPTARPPFFPKPNILPALSLKWCVCDTCTFMLDISPSSLQWSPMFLVPGSGFMEDNFSRDHGGGWFVMIQAYHIYSDSYFYCISCTSDHHAWLGTPALYHLQAHWTHDSRPSCSSTNLYMMHVASPFARPGSKNFRCDKPHLIITAIA